MTTEITYELHIDQQASVTMTLDIEAAGDPERGWRIAKVVCTELAVWLDDDQAEEPQALCVNKTAWLHRLTAQDKTVQRQIEEALDAQYERDHEDDYVLCNPTWQRAVLLGVD